LRGARVELRPLTPADYDAWFAVRDACRSWLTVWEPRLAGAAPLAEDRTSFTSRCNGRLRERQLGYGFAYGIFEDRQFRGEITLSNLQRGPVQGGVIGYWIDRAAAGRGLMPESVAVLLAAAFDDLRLHRVEVNIIPRNTASRRVAEKLGLRLEGTSVGFLAIDGVWEDHLRFAITEEEWAVRGPELKARFGVSG
jgi:ribosomal-protein-alanine N-acetyltransferase